MTELALKTTLSPILSNVDMSLSPPKVKNISQSAELAFINQFSTSVSELQESKCLSEKTK